MKKRVLSVLLVLCMALGMLPGTALAANAAGRTGARATNVVSVKINNQTKSFATMEEAWEAVIGAEADVAITVTLLQDTSLASDTFRLEVYGGKTVNFEGGSYTLTCSNENICVFAVSDDSTLNIKSGTISSDGSGGSLQAVVLVNGPTKNQLEYDPDAKPGVLNISGGKISRGDAPADSSIIPAIKSQGGTINMTGGTVEGNNCEALSLDRSAVISGGRITSNYYTCVSFHDIDGLGDGLTVSGTAVIESTANTSTAMTIGSGKTVIKGGTIKSAGQGIQLSGGISIGPNGDETRHTGTLIFENGTLDTIGYGLNVMEGGVATITGGSFTSANNHALSISGGSAEIVAGTFMSPGDNQASVEIEFESNVKIDGGTFTGTGFNGGIFANDGNIEINGGTFSPGMVICGGNCEITGGTFDCSALDAWDSFGLITRVWQSTPKLSISGGTFTGNTGGISVDESMSLADLLKVEEGKTYGYFRDGVQIPASELTDESYLTGTITVGESAEPPAPTHNHSWAADWTNNTTHHWHECTASGCDISSDSGKSGYGAHVYDNDTDATCNTCGYTRTVTPPAPTHTHSWDTSFTISATHHWHECSASGCPVTSNSGKDGYGAHVYDNDADATCDTCGYTRTVTPPAPTHTHSWDTSFTVSATHHWHECSASGCPVTSNSGKDGYGAHIYDNDADATCDTCGYTRTVTPPAPIHTHSWAAAWSSSTTHHWHECTASGCDITSDSGKDGYGAHIYDNDTDTTCNTCGYTRTVTIVTPSVTDKLDSILNNAAAADIPAQMQELTSQELQEALMDAGLRKMLERLEEKTGIKVDTTVDEALETRFPKSQVKITGAALNKKADTADIVLSIGKPAQAHTLSDRFNTRVAIPFSMTLNVDKVDNLAVPVRVVLPVPDFINLNQLAILHYRNDMTYKTYTGSSLDCEAYIEGGKQYVALILDHFSDFVMTELSNEDETYYISVPKTANGEVIPSVRYAEQGERVTLSVRPDSGYELEDLTVEDIRGRALTVRDMGNGRYSFTMPNTRVTVDASFVSEEETPASTVSVPGTNHTAHQPDGEVFTGLGTPGISGIVLNPTPMTFTDVHPKDWFYENVDYVWKHYLMSGVSEEKFAPHTTTSRAMIWTVLARMNNERTDINPGATWYERGMIWAKERGITDGTNPLGDITREQLAAMLWRNAGSPGGTGDLSQFSDAGTISSYAQAAVRWAVGNGILNGSNGELNPKGTATRAQVAAMVARYGDKMA